MSISIIDIANNPHVNKNSELTLIWESDWKDSFRERQEFEEKQAKEDKIEIKKNKTDIDGEYYWIGFWITGIITFIGSWIYAIAHYGFFLGVGLGWLPSLIITLIAGLLWPLVAVLLIIGIIFVVYLLFINT